MTDLPNPAASISIPSSDILSLISSHLTEAGLHATAQTLQTEAGGVGLAGTLHAPSQWQGLARQGQWGMILSGLKRLDAGRMSSERHKELMHRVYEITILELADAGDWQVAYATFRCVQRDMEDTNNNMARSIEQKLAELASLRQHQPSAPVPQDYYVFGETSSSRQEQRDDIGRQLSESIPQQPSQRLTTLLQQAVLWQNYTGQLPQRRYYEQEGEQHGEEGSSRQKRKRKKKLFDLVLGTVNASAASSSTDTTTLNSYECPIRESYSTIQLGKGTTCQAALFTNDGSLITGSSDGLIEVWDAAKNYEHLRTHDLEYQANDELMGHEASVISALALSRDGQLLASADATVVQVWRWDKGVCVRRFQNNTSTTSNVTALAVAPDGTRIFGGCSNGSGREWGLRTSRVLYEYQGHGSVITSAEYVDHYSDDTATPVLLVTGSGDGTVRVWDPKSAECLRVLVPFVVVSEGGAESIAVDVTQQQSLIQSGGVVALLPLHTPVNCMIAVSTDAAVMVDFLGRVRRTFESQGNKVDSNKVFVAATISHSNRTLYIVRNDGVCCVFDVAKGTEMGTLPDFGSQTTRKKASGSSSTRPIEVTAIVAHPQKNILAAFSNDKSQKKGQVVIWK